LLSTALEVATGVAVWNAGVAGGGWFVIREIKFAGITGAAKVISSECCSSEATGVFVSNDGVTGGCCVVILLMKLDMLSLRSSSIDDSSDPAPHRDGGALIGTTAAKAIAAGVADAADAVAGVADAGVRVAEAKPPLVCCCGFCGDARVAEAVPPLVY
jgi:hypothetical protein